MKLPAALAAFAALAAGQETLEFEAAVRSVEGATVVLAAGPYSHDYRPRVGDLATFRTRVPGIGWSGLRGEWRVVRILADVRTVAVEQTSPGAMIPGMSDRALISTSVPADRFRLESGEPPLVQYIVQHRCGRAAESLRQGADAAAASAALLQVRHCPDLLGRLLAAGANPNHSAEGHPPPLHAAVQARDIDGVRTLLRAGADRDRQGYNRQTALMHAIEAKDLEIVQALIEAGASLAPQDGKGLTAADYARDTRNPEIVRLTGGSPPAEAGTPQPPGPPAPALPATPEAVPPRTFPLRHAHPTFTRLHIASATLTLQPGSVLYREDGDGARLEHDFTFTCRNFRQARVSALNRAERNSVRFLQNPAKLTLHAGKSLGQLFEERETVAEIVRAVKEHCGKR